LAPAISYATHGFPVTQLIALYWKGNMAAFEKDKALIEELDNARATYLIDGRTPEEGEVFRNPDLGNTLTLIAEQGRDGFYKGPISQTVDAYFRRIGGDLRYEDFANHHGEWVTPLAVNYRGYEVHELPPNGQGAAVLQIMQILKGFDLAKMGAGSADTLTAKLEAKRLAYEDLAKWYADPAMVKVPIEGLLSEAYADERRKLIDLARPNPDFGPGDPRLHIGDTIYLTTADKDGMMVSLIQSNYRGMGSGLVADGLGFMFQDRGELFSLNPHDANIYAPGKRPFHTIIPGFVTKDDQPFLSFGLMGGDMQPQGHVQVLTDIIDFGMNVQERGDASLRRSGGHRRTFDRSGHRRNGIGLRSGSEIGTRKAGLQDTARHRQFRRISSDHVERQTPRLLGRVGDAQGRRGDWLLTGWLFDRELRAMKALWEDLSREPDRIELPSWHQDVLKETESGGESGAATFSARSIQSHQQQLCDSTVEFPNVSVLPLKGLAWL
jgi:gamma-glutamyltranspeptidase/glutathione hydrolase